MIKLPVMVMLRNKGEAVLQGVTKLGPEFAPERFIVGHTPEEPCEMWYRNGKWRENGTPHPLDVVGFKNPDGSFSPLTNELT